MFSAVKASFNNKQINFGFDINKICTHVNILPETCTRIEILHNCYTKERFSYVFRILCYWKLW